MTKISVSIVKNKNFQGSTSSDHANNTGGSEPTPQLTEKEVQAQLATTAATLLKCHSEIQRMYSEMDLHGLP